MRCDGCPKLLRVYVYDAPRVYAQLGSKRHRLTINEYAVVMGALQQRTRPVPLRHVDGCDQPTDSPRRVLERQHLAAVGQAEREPLPRPHPLSPQPRSTPLDQRRQFAIRGEGRRRIGISAIAGKLDPAVVGECDARPVPLTQPLHKAQERPRGHPGRAAPGFCPREDGHDHAAALVARRMCLPPLVGSTQCRQPRRRDMRGVRYSHRAASI